MKKKNYFILILFSLFCSFFFDGDKVGAVNYSYVCNETIDAKSGKYGACGNKNIFLIKDTRKSSYLVSSLKLYDGAQIVYAGKVGNIDTFYALNFQYFSVIYDDRGLTTGKEDYWSEVARNGIVIYSGWFKDTILDDSETKPVVKFKEVGEYIIKQYIGNSVVKTIRVNIISKKSYDIFVSNPKYGSENINSGVITSFNENLTFDITGGQYGFGKTVDVEVNDCKFSVQFSKNLKINNSKFRNCLRYNINNNISLTISNGLNISKTFKYFFLINSSSVAIRLSNSVAATETSSRRIEIIATAGVGKNLDRKYNLYYWSKSPNDSLNYNDFMTNYENSDYRGSYTDGRGVILRDAVGTYYLYALAKDDDSTVVVRSDKYILKKDDKLVDTRNKDILFVIFICILAAVPIFIYLGIKKRI